MPRLIGTQGSLAFELSTGADDALQCLEFGGTIVKDVPATGQFKARDAPAPAMCAVP